MRLLILVSVQLSVEVFFAITSTCFKLSALRGFTFWILAETNRRICFLNVSPDEVIRSLFYNKNNDSLITVSVYASDNFSSLKCRSTRIEYVCLSLIGLYLVASYLTGLCEIMSLFWLFFQLLGIF